MTEFFWFPLNSIGLLINLGLWFIILYGSYSLLKTIFNKIKWRPGPR